MKIKKLQVEKRIRITDGQTLGAEYNNKIFVKTDDGFSFIDWLNGSLSNGLTKPLTSVIYEDLSESYSLRYWNDISRDVREYVQTLLTARLMIQRGELNYPYEDASQYGSPSWLKKRKLEVDLILRAIILETPGVVGIKSFDSSVNQKREYLCETEIICAGGETLWQSIAI